MLPNIRRVALALAVSGLAAALPGTAYALDGFSAFSVNALGNGTIRSSVGVKSVVQQATGNYVVTFNHTISPACSFTTSLVSVNPGYAVAFYQAGTTNGIVVRTFNKTGVATNFGFSLIVTCGP